MYTYDKTQLAVNGSQLLKSYFAVIVCIDQKGFGFSLTAIK